MPHVKLDPLRSALVIIDVQPSLAKTIFEIKRVLLASRFLVNVARLLEIPIFSTEQNPSRLGSTVPELQPFLASHAVFPKMTFSAVSYEPFLSALRASGRTQIIVIGLETHICVSETALDLLTEGFEVVVCPDAVSSRTIERHKLGMERIRDAGVVPAHSESVAYEWIGSADSEHFKAFLAVVKEFSSE